MSSCSGHLEACLERGLGLGLTGCSWAWPGGWGRSPPPRTNLLSFFPLTLVLSRLSQLLPGARRCRMAQGEPKRSPCFTSSPNPTCLVTRGSSPSSSWPPRAGWPGAPRPGCGCPAAALRSLHPDASVATWALGSRPAQATSHGDGPSRLDDLLLARTNLDLWFERLWQRINKECPVGNKKEACL